MFQRILVVLDDPQTRGCVLNTALGFAKAHQAQILLMDAAPEEMRNDTVATLRFAKAHVSILGVEVECATPFEQTDHALLDVAKTWGADLLLIGHAMKTADVFPCSILVVQQGRGNTISMTMQCKPKPRDFGVRNRLEKLLELTPSSESSFL